MSQQRARFEWRPCRDSHEMGQARAEELKIPRERAADLGREAVEAARRGYYVDTRGRCVEWAHLVEKARESKVSIPPDAALPQAAEHAYGKTTVEVANETTLQAAARLSEAGLSPVALNFANGVHPGGGFLGGARAQEEVLCRSSALYETLEGDPMYAAHARRAEPDSTDWAIYSPGVPVFRCDDGTTLDRPWLLSFITCAAPYAPAIGQPRSAELLAQRIRRVLAITHAYGHPSVVLGAWGCGAFHNDPNLAARDFREALEETYPGAFSAIAFAVTDWSADRRYIGPFCAHLAQASGG